MDAHLYKHILVMNHINHGDISPDLRSLELILVPLRQKVVYGILQLVVMSVVKGDDSLPCSVSYNISLSRSES
jgi:hypothetical protein